MAYFTEMLNENDFFEFSFDIDSTPVDLQALDSAFTPNDVIDPQLLTKQLDNVIEPAETTASETNIEVSFFDYCFNF